MDEPPVPGMAFGARLPVLAVIIAVLFVIVVCSTVSVAQTSSYSATLTDSGSGLTSQSTNYSPAHSGMFSFSWHSRSGATVTFSVLGPSGMSLYSSVAASGSGTLYVFRAATYQFGMYDAQTETVRLTGTLSFTAPLI